MGHENEVRLKIPWVLLALMQMLLICIFHFKYCVIVTQRYLMFSTFARKQSSTIGSQRTLNVSRQPMVALVLMVPLVETLVQMVPLVGPMVSLVSPTTM